MSDYDQLYRCTVCQERFTTNRSRVCFACHMAQMAEDEDALGPIWMGDDEDEEDDGRFGPGDWHERYDDEDGP